MNFRPFSLAAALIAGTVIFNGCATSQSKRELATVQQVDLNRYSGKWHEVLRLPNRFQKQGEGALAEYRPAAGGKVTVRNTALKADGKTRSIEGAAEPVAGSNNARLKVKFSGFAALAPVPKDGNYWIIALDPGYRYAMVGTPDRNYLWILSRTPALPRPVTDRLLSQAKAQGFATERVQWDVARH